MKRLTLVVLILVLAQLSFAKKEKWNKVSEKETKEATISVYKKIADSSVRRNPDGVVFLNTSLRMELNIEGKKKKIKLPDTYYLTEKKEYINMPQTFFYSNCVYLFVFEKTDEPQNYGMKGVVYTYNLDSKKLGKVKIFDRANWGWYSYFEMAENGNLELRCFSAAGRFDMKFVNKDKDYWQPVFPLGNMTHEEAKARYMKNR